MGQSFQSVWLCWSADIIFINILLVLLPVSLFDNHKKENDGFDDKEITARLLRLGIPMALQSVITSVGGLIVVNRINQYDITFLAGYTAAVKLYGLLEIAASSFGLAAAAYVSHRITAQAKKAVSERASVPA